MSENTNIGLTVEAWAKIVIERWEQKIKALKIGNTSSGKLLASILANDFSKQIQRDANGNPEKIVFAFEYYGKFVDMGVGRGVKMADVDNGKTDRKRKPWYSPVFFGQVKEMSRILAEKYGIKGQLSIVTGIGDNQSLSNSVNQ
jgi:hypothetical protein